MINSKETSTLNIERLIIYTIVLLIIITLILQTDFSIISIIPFVVIYFMVVIFYIITPFLKKENQKSNELLFINDLPKSFEKFKKISRKHYSYDNDIFYAMNDYEQRVTAIPFLDIIEVTKTAVKIKNRRFWKVVALYNNEELTFKFRHNYTLWNHNFPHFLKELKHVNPKAIVSKWNILNM